MIIHNVLQNSEAWEALRRGRPTASRFSDIITAAKGELSKSATSYIYELLAETFVTDEPPTDFFGTRWTDRGLGLEEEAAAAFSAATGLEVITAGFVTMDNGVVGCSPDRFVIDPVTLEPIAGLEMKCPAPKKHVEIMDGKGLPLDYRQQVHGSLVITGLPCWWFASFCPGMQPFIAKVEPDDYTEKVRSAVEQFVIDYAAARARLIPKLQIKTS